MTTPRTFRPARIRDGRPRLMPLRDVALKTRTPWETIHARYKAGTLSFRVVKVQYQLYVYRAEWDAYMDRVLNGYDDMERAA